MTEELAPPKIKAQPTRERIYLNRPLQFRRDVEGPVFVGCNERIVEAPFIYNNLPYPFQGRVLDIGCCESQMCFELGCLGFEIWGVDTRLPLLRFPGVQYVRADICKSPFTSAAFDVVIACSTIEHIGLIAYGNEQYNPNADLNAVEVIHHLLKPEGRLILTAPFGKRGTTDWYRVYDYEAIRQLLPPGLFTIRLENFWRRMGLRWIPTSRWEAEEVDSLSDGAHAVACIVASRAS